MKHILKILVFSVFISISGCNLFETSKSKVDLGQPSASSVTVEKIKISSIGDAYDFYDFEDAFFEDGIEDDSLTSLISEKNADATNQPDDFKLNAGEFYSISIAVKVDSVIQGEDVSFELSLISLDQETEGDIVIDNALFEKIESGEGDIIFDTLIPSNIPEGQYVLMAKTLYGDASEVTEDDISKIKEMGAIKVSIKKSDSIDTVGIIDSDSGDGYIDLPYPMTYKSNYTLEPIGDSHLVIFNTNQEEKNLVISANLVLSDNTSYPIGLVDPNENKIQEKVTHIASGNGENFGGLDLLYFLHQNHYDEILAKIPDLSKDFESEHLAKIEWIITENNQDRKVFEEELNLAKFNDDDFFADDEITDEEMLNEPKNFVRTSSKNTTRNMSDKKASFYQHCNFDGYKVELAAGRYTHDQMIASGIKNDDLSSIKVPDGLKVKLFEHDNFQGRSWEFTGNDTCLVNEGANDQASSIEVISLDRTKQATSSENLLNGQLFEYKGDAKYTLGKRSRFALGLDSEYALEGRWDLPSVSAKGEGNLALYIFNAQNVFLATEAEAVAGLKVLNPKAAENGKENKRRVGTKLNVSVLGSKIYDKNNIEEEEVTEKASSDATAEQKKKYEDEAKSEKKGFSMPQYEWKEKKTFVKQRFTIGPVPLSVEGGAEGSIKVETDVNIEGIGVALTGEVPVALSAFVAGGIDIWIAKAGVEGTFIMVDTKPEAKVRGGLSLRDSQFLFDIESKLEYALKALKGKISLYASRRSIKCRWWSCKTTWKDYRLNIYESPWAINRSWTPLEKTIPIKNFGGF